MTQDLPDIKVSKNDDWLNYGVITWLVNSMEPHISRDVVMPSTTKKI